MLENGVAYRNAFAASGSQGNDGSDAGNQQGEEAREQHGMSVVGQRFLAGVLAHLPAILALSSPLPNRWVVPGGGSTRHELLA